MRFMMLMIPEGYQTAQPDKIPDPEAVAAMVKYNEALKDAGVLLSLDGLHPPSGGVRISFPGGKAKVTPGPVPESKEALGGYWMIQVKSKDEAIAWASQVPVNDGSVVEVRQVFEIKEFSEEIRAAAGDFPARMKEAGR